METTFVAARIDSAVRNRALEVLRQAGLNDSQFIRRMYAHVASSNQVPQCVLDVEYDGVRMTPPDDKFQHLVAWVSEGPYASMDFSFLTDEAVRETLDERGAQW